VSLKRIIAVKMVGEVKVKGRQGRIRKQLLYDIKKNEGELEIKRGSTT
jgi:hypothetical protein